MRVTVLGLGYVGSVCAACLARDGFEVVGVDVSPAKVDAVESGQSPVLEPGLPELIAQGKAAGRLRACVSLDAEARESDLFLLAVGTPSAPNGSSDLTHLLRATEQVADALRGIDRFQAVCVRSTVPPGTLRSRVIPILEERSGRKVGSDLGVAMNPEFLREGTSIRDYDTAPFDLCGATDEKTLDLVRRLYASRGRPFRSASLETAEFVKYLNNAFHALKVAFANEAGRLARAKGVDSFEAMRLLCEDRRLNISPAYLRPGMAFGGSCLPKDLRALVYEAGRGDVRVPLLEGVLDSNETHLKAAAGAILAHGRPRTLVVGLSFKAGTDDLRESPMVRLVETLIGRGVPVRVYDPRVRLSALVGANREYIEREIPHIGSLLVENLAEGLRDAELVVVGSDDPEVDRLPSLVRENQKLIDLVGRLAEQGKAKGGVCW